MNKHRADLINEFILRHRLPATFVSTVEGCYLPLVSWLAGRRNENKSLLLGINGAQGTGKSTLADFLKVAFESAHGWHVAVLSIDDFYLTRKERAKLAQAVHPLLATRGVPGTHDVPLLRAYLANLARLNAGETLAPPRFDKSADDRAEPSDWPVVAGPLDLIILEGWCVGSVPQSARELERPVNDLEQNEDPTGAWRQYVNSRLAAEYSPLFAQLDALVFLRAPSFEAVYRWRLTQERKLADAVSKDSPGIMNESEISRFIKHYERLTRANLARLPETADVVIELDENHECVRSRYRR